MSLESATLAGRVAAERAMLDLCTVHRVVGENTDQDGNVTPVASLVYAGRCKVQAWVAQESNPEAGGFTGTLQRYSVHVPVGSFRPAVGQVVTVTQSRLDPQLTAKEFRVVALLHKSAATAYRLGVESEDQ